MSDPQRLLGSRDGLARALLGSAPAPDLSDDKRDAIFRSLATRLPEAVIVGSALTKASGIKLAVLLKAALAIGVVGSATVAGVWVATRPASVSAPLPVVVSTAPPALVSAPPPPPRVSAAPTPLDLPDAPVVAAPKPRAKALPAPPPSAAPKIEESSLGAESATLLHARKLLRAGDCAGAAKELEAARGRFSGGKLAQEREAVAIEALACAGEGDRASSRASAFLEAYPSSPHADAIRKYVR